MLTRRTAFLLLFLLGLGLSVSLVGCTPATDPWGGKPTPHVLVSVPPLYSFAKSITGEHGQVECLCKDVGPHGYQYSLTDKRLLSGATCFISVGPGLDDKFGDDLMKTRPDAERLVLSDKLPADLKLEGEHGADPHLWNGTPQAIAMVQLIRDELKKIDEAHKDKYDENATAYIEELKKLHDYGVKLFKGKKNRKIISFHESLGYFAKEFDIEIVDVIEDIPGGEAAVEKIRKLVKECMDKDVHVIAVEPQYPTTTAASLIMKELEAKGKKDVYLIEIDPLETAPEKELTAELYIKTMRKNLDLLSASLK
jgi:zinc transport system substrate-binding protein